MWIGSVGGRREGLDTMMTVLSVCGVPGSIGVDHSVPEVIMSGCVGSEAVVDADNCGGPRQRWWTPTTSWDPMKSGHPIRLNDDSTLNCACPWSSSRLSSGFLDGIGSLDNGFRSSSSTSKR